MLVLIESEMLLLKLCTIRTLHTSVEAKISGCARTKEHFSVTLELGVITNQLQAPEKGA